MYNAELKSLTEVMQSCYKELGFKDYEVMLVASAQRPTYEIILRKEISHLVRIVPDKIIPEFFAPILDSPKYKQLIEENLTLKRLLDKDPCENLNLNWE
jgi:hypothetical protein